MANGNGGIDWQSKINFGGEVVNFSRQNFVREIRDSTQSTITALVGGYNLSSAARDNIETAAENLRGVYCASPIGEVGYIEDRASIGPAHVATRRLTVVSPIGAVGQPVKPTEIFLGTKSITDEYEVLQASADKFAAKTQVNPDLASTQSGRRVIELHEEPEVTRSVAVQLAFARRVVKYGLLADHVMPPGSRSEYGYPEWLEEQQATHNRGRKFPKATKALLHDTYVDMNIATKNLRRSVWPDVADQIIGVGAHEEVMFYIFQRDTKADTQPSHTIAFDQPGTVTVGRQDTTHALTAIFNPAEFALKLIPGSKK